MVVSRRSVVETEEKEPRVGNGRGGKSRGGNERIPEFANRGSTEEGRDRKGRENEFGEVDAKGVDVRFFRIVV